MNRCHTIVGHHRQGVFCLFVATLFHVPGRLVVFQIVPRIVKAQDIGVAGRAFALYMRGGRTQESRIALQFVVLGFDGRVKVHKERVSSCCSIAIVSRSVFSSSRYLLFHGSATCVA